MHLEHAGILGNPPSPGNPAPAGKPSHNARSARLRRFAPVGGIFGCPGVADLQPEMSYYAAAEITRHLRHDGRQR